MEYGTIHHGDCLDIMHDWQDGCFDWVITDPPYGQGIGGGGRIGGNKAVAGKGVVYDARDYTGMADWDDSRPAPEYFADMLRIGRKWVGIDISAEYCEIARKRTAQKGLFTTEAPC